jgi:predicted transcriptional regulator
MAQGVEVSIDTILRMQELSRSGKTQTEIAKELGISQTTVAGYVQKGIKGASGKSLRLKARILEELSHGETYNTAGDIMLRIRRQDENLDLHKVVHNIYDLHAQGAVELKEMGIGGGEKIPTQIRLRKKTERPTTPPQEREEELRREAERVTLIGQKKANGHSPMYTPIQVELPPRPEEPLPDRKWPELTALYWRSGKVATAIRVLQEAGLEAVADTVRADAKFTAIELEMIDWMHRTGFKPDPTDS